MTSTVAAASPGAAGQHSRSRSANTSPSPVRRSVSRSGSSPQYPSMATMLGSHLMPPQNYSPHPSQYGPDRDQMTTLKDPRTPPKDDFPAPRSTAADSSPHPDLNMEVETLSNKLISAINHQTHLDDALAATRQELEAAQEKALRLDAQNREHKLLIANGDLVKKSELDQLRTALAEERKRRQMVEKEKKSIETELENLSAALFEEANHMVSNARKETEASEKRNEQLKQQIKDTEVLLVSQQEQLSQLKSVMADMRSEEEERESSTAPSTPALSAYPGRRKSRDLSLGTPTAIDESNPAPPTTFVHLLSPVLRTDLQAFDDFKSLIEISRRSAPSSRVNSGSYAGMQVPGLPTNLSSPLGQSHQANNGSQVSLTSASNTSQPPSVQQQNMQSMSSPMIPLKETKFYKRALTEDIEPTLRLDTAPGLSWMTRRGVVTSMCEGSFIVEPMPTSNKMAVFSCALCGENRRSSEFARTHRFKTNDSESAQRYPLCNYCLNRVRSCCDYLGFLRMVKDGHFRADGKDGEKAAWEESVRLRERMFWARIGGGVVPAFGIGHDSPRPSTDDVTPPTPFSAPPHINGVTIPDRTASSASDEPPRTDASKLSADSATRARSQSRPKLYDPRDDWESAKRSGIFDDAPPPDSAKTLSSSMSLSPSKDSLNGQSLRESLRIRPRSRGQSYEVDKTTPGSDTSGNRSRKASPSPTPITEDSGLHISIPGGFV